MISEEAQGENIGPENAREDRTWRPQSYQRPQSAAGVRAARAPGPLDCVVRHCHV